MKTTHQAVHLLSPVALLTMNLFPTDGLFSVANLIVAGHMILAVLYEILVVAHISLFVTHMFWVAAYIQFAIDHNFCSISLYESVIGSLTILIHSTSS